MTSRPKRTTENVKELRVAAAVDDPVRPRQAQRNWQGRAGFRQALPDRHHHAQALESGDRRPRGRLARVVGNRVPLVFRRWRQSHDRRDQRRRRRGARVPRRRCPGSRRRLRHGRREGHRGRSDPPRHSLGLSLVPREAAFLRDVARDRRLDDIRNRLPTDPGRRHHQRPTSAASRRSTTTSSFPASQSSIPS